MQKMGLSSEGFGKDASGFLKRARGFVELGHRNFTFEKKSCEVAQICSRGNLGHEL